MARITIVPHDYEDFEITCGDQRVWVRSPAWSEPNPPAEKKEDADEKKDSDSGDKDKEKPRPKPGLGPFSPYIPLFVWPGVGEVSHFTAMHVNSVNEIGSRLDVSVFPPAGERRLVVFLTQAIVDMHELVRMFEGLPADAEVTVVLTRLDA